MRRQGGWWLIRRGTGLTCPVCKGMGTTGDGDLCAACHGRRYIWDSLRRRQ